MRIQNVVNLLNVIKKKKTPMTTPNQIKELKRLLLAYNGEGVADYENILGLYIDAGSGGAGVNISDFLWEDWEDEDGNMHRAVPPVVMRCLEELNVLTTSEMEALKRFRHEHLINSLGEDVGKVNPVFHLNEA